MSSDTNSVHSIDEERQASPQMTDPDLSPEITEALDSLIAHVRSASSAFACGGTISKKQLDMRAVTLFFKNTNNLGSAEIPLGSQAIKDINDAAQPSQHGVGERTVYDPSYRQAKEITIPHFSLSPDPILHSGILGLLQHKLVHPRPLRAELYKLNVYAEGGFFKPHRDTPRGQKHIGTLLLSLPSVYSGGALVVRQNGTEVYFDWSKSTGLEWAFLYSDCEHEVLPVTSGHRVTVQYNIFDTPSKLIISDALVPTDSRLQIFNSTIKTLLSANKDLTLGIALRHEYPRDRYSNLDDLDDGLKGQDRVLMQAIVAAGLEWDFRVVWQLDDSYWEEQEDYYETESEKWDLPYRHRCMTSDDYWPLDGAYMEEGLWSYLQDNGARARDDVLWISEPRSYENEVIYTTYGNEAQTETTYAALAMFVTLPRGRAE